MREDINATWVGNFLGEWLTQKEDFSAPTWSCASYKVWVSYLHFLVELNVKEAFVPCQNLIDLNLILFQSADQPLGQQVSLPSQPL
jgi:hypothetical protein